MRISKLKIIFTYFTVQVVLAAFFLMSPARLFAANTFDIEIPGQVGIGQPFLVYITSQLPLKKLTISWNEKTVEPSVNEKEGLFRAMIILGVGLNSKSGRHPLIVTMIQKGKIKKIIKSVEVVNTVFQKEKLKVATGLIKPPGKLTNRIKRERKSLLVALNTISSRRYWTMPFSRPVKGKMLSRFGLRRVFNGKTKRRHRGLDFRAWEGTPIYSMAGGRVILAGNFYFAGKCVFIDHGNGLVSFSCHMSKVLVKKGDHIVSTQKIGLSGATGRVNGAHLHLSVFSLGTAINPEPFFNGTLKKKD